MNGRCQSRGAKGKRYHLTLLRVGYYTRMPICLRCWCVARCAGSAATAGPRSWPTIRTTVHLLRARPVMAAAALLVLLALAALGSLVIRRRRRAGGAAASGTAAPRRRGLSGPRPRLPARRRARLDLLDGDWAVPLVVLPMSEFGKRLMRLMKERDFSQSDVAAKLGVSTAAISTWIT